MKIDRSFQRLSRIAFAAILCGLSFCGVSLTGCQANRYSERFGLGTIDRQKAKAADFDPYPLNDIGPSVVGGRPPGFFNPLPEARRNELMGNRGIPR